MAFRASNAIPADKFDEARRKALQIKRYCTNQSASMSGGGNAAQVLAVAENLGVQKAALEAIKNTPGIGQYAKEQEDDPLYDVAAEFQALLDALQDVIDNIVATVPKDGSGYLLTHTINNDGTLTPRGFSGGQLSGLRSKLNAVAAAVS